MKLLLWAAAVLPTCSSLPNAGDNLGLWYCGSAAGWQAWQYVPPSGARAAARPPLRTQQNDDAYPASLFSHFLVNGTDATSPTLVWDIAGPSNNTGTNIHVWGSYDPAVNNQKWTLTPVATSIGLAGLEAAAGAVQIVSNYNSMCIASTGPFIGASIVIVDCNVTDPLQQWVYNSNGNNLSVSIASMPNMCIQAGNTTPSCSIPPFSGYEYCNSSVPVATRVADLISRMTVAEKTAALDSSIPSIPRLGVPSMASGEALHGAATGCISNPASGSTGCPTSFPCPMALSASFDAQLWSDVGLAIGTEARALHAAGVGNLWLFAPNLNPMRDPRWGRAQEVPGEDPFVVSSYGLSFIAGLQGKGFNTSSVHASSASSSSSTAGSSADVQYLLAASTVKHFIAYDLEGYEPRTDVLPRPPTAVCDTGSDGGCQRWNFDAFPLQPHFDNYYLPPFEAAVEAGVRSVMCSYNAINGQPACASPLLNALLRDGMGWDGHVVSDCTAIELMQDAKWDSCPGPYPPLNCVPDSFPGHNYTMTVAGTALAAFEAGTDVNCGPFYKMWLDYLVTNGSVPVSYIDTALTRVYTTAVRLGLLDGSDASSSNPFNNIPSSVIDSQAHRDLALKAAREGIVLLQNNAGSSGTPILPLANAGAGLKIAFIGPHANSTQAFLSSYHGSNTLVDSHSPLMVAQSRGLNVAYSSGCNICDIIPPGFPNMPCPPGKANDTSAIPAAVAAAQAADVAVLFIGSDQTTEAENFDRNGVVLTGVQEQLVQSVLAAQPNTIVVFVSGGPVSSIWIKENVPSVLYSFYPGELGGDALVDVLTGAYNPSGKLPVTVYHSNITDLRDTRDMDLTANGGITHIYHSGPVVYPFGWGLSFASFQHRIVSVAVNSVEGDSYGRHPQFSTSGGAAGSKSMALGVPSSAFSGITSFRARKHHVLTAVTSVTNTGSVAGDAVVFLFAQPSSANAASTTASGQPRQVLLAFERVHDLAPGESRSVMLHVDASNPNLRALLSASAGSSGSSLGAFALRFGGAADDFDGAVLELSLQ